jgi:hypothetical protein
LLVIAVFCVSVRFSFASDQIVAFGFILNVPDSKGYKIERKLSRHINPNSPFLYEGDQVIVLKEGIQVTISLGGTEEKVITKKDSPYTVLEMKIPTEWSNFTGWVSDLFKGEDTTNTQGGTEGVSIRGPSDTPKQTQDSLRMDLLPADGDYYLLKGKRPLYLIWSGGKPPYAVKITKKGSCEETIDFFVSSESRVKIDGTDFKVGTDYYEVTVKDSNKGNVKGQFSVVEKPSDLQEKLEEIKNPEIQQMAQAARLAQKDKKWSFEVYQQISAIADGNSKGIAEELRTRLERRK